MYIHLEDYKIDMGITGKGFYKREEEKNIKLLDERGIGFDDIIDILINENYIDIINNPSQNFPHQKAYVVNYSDYIYYVPFVEDKNHIFLKTIIQSRKLNKKYL